MMILHVETLEKTCIFLHSIRFGYRRTVQIAGAKSPNGNISCSFKATMANRCPSRLLARLYGCGSKPWFLAHDPHHHNGSRKTKLWDQLLVGIPGDRHVKNPHVGDILPLFYVGKHTGPFTLALCGYGSDHWFSGYPPSKHWSPTYPQTPT